MIPIPVLKEELPKRVVVGDDDDVFRESLSLNLSEAGYKVQDFSDGEKALEFLINGEGADAVLLDWRMPSVDGLTVLRRLREARSQVPVVLLTALGDQVYEEAALRYGAVDFIEKSRRLTIILQRLKLITEGPKAAPASAPEVTTDTGEIGPIEFDESSKRARWRGQEIDLTLTEYVIVRHLATSTGRDVTYRQIYDLVRGKNFIAGNGMEGYRANVRAFIKRIRKKFKDVDPEFEAIENYPGYGYRWRGNDEGGASHSVGI
jgi:two-component system response regulator ChvI